MADQQDTSDQSGAIGPDHIYPVEFQASTQRVASQDRGLDAILTILKGDFPSPLTPIVVSTYDASTPTPQATPSPNMAHAAPVPL
ncbi:hypothetical protein Syun_023079 [Stephania yunnanensis]|uniref:Uncharacterized protein n=1 Tax=Stephania yunnanensis TaxID=152371 RepID=A0AAP0HZ78_9MAGN